jgi:peroxiredoxin
VVVTRLLLLFALAGCAQARAPVSAPSIVVADTAGGAVDIRAEAAKTSFTVVTFFSAHCPCQRAHDERMRALYKDFAPRGVGFVAVDAEAGASADRARTEHDVRKYPYPILVDARGASADALGAEYATFTVVLDRDGRVRYAGGIDSDRSHLTDDAHAYLRDALDDLLAGRDPRVAHGKALGCALQR